MSFALQIIFCGSDLQCVLPAGVEFYGSGFDSNDPSTLPRSYPIVLTGMLVAFT